MHNLQLFFDKYELDENSFKRLLIDTANKKLAVGNFDKANDVIRESMFTALGIDMDSYKDGIVPIRDIRRAYKKHKLDVFEILTVAVEDKLTTGWKESEWFQNFVEMRSIALGDRNEFTTKKDVYLTVNRVSGNHHDVSVQRLGEGSYFSVETCTYSAAVGTDIELYLTGRRDWSELVNAVYSAFDRKVKDMMYAEVIKVGDALPSNSQFHKTSALTKTEKPVFDTLLSDVSTANDDEDVVIMGTRTAIAKVADLTLIDWVSENMKDEHNKTGRVGYYEGRVIFEIPQRFALGDTSKKLVDPNKLLIVPATMDKFVKFVDVGDAEINEITDRAARQDDSMVFEYKRTMGIATIIGKYIGEWDITA